ncbi:hypothetical protein GFJ40_04400 [Bifidobacterium breve]|nr:hypothetical protein GFJ40_04400 [Bifidobacterium breve]
MRSWPRRNAMHRGKTHCIPSHIQKEQQIMKYFTTDTHFGHYHMSLTCSHAHNYIFVLSMIL